MTHPVGTEVGVPRMDVAKLEVLGRGIERGQEGLGELREDYLDSERALMKEEPDGWKAALGSLRKDYFMRELAQLSELRKARAEYTTAVKEVASKLGLDLDGEEEWKFFPDSGVFERTA